MCQKNKKGTRFKLTPFLNFADDQILLAVTPCFFLLPHVCAGPHLTAFRECTLYMKIVDDQHLNDDPLCRGLFYLVFFLLTLKIAFGPPKMGSEHRAHCLCQIPLKINFYLHF